MLRLTRFTVLSAALVALGLFVGGSSASAQLTLPGPGCPGCATNSFCNPHVCLFNRVCVPLAAPCSGGNIGVCDEDADQCRDCDADGDLSCSAECYEHAETTQDVDLIFTLAYYCQRDAACAEDTEANAAGLCHDCDDENATAYPGGVEVCDLGSADEDCNPSTLAGAGEGDDDRDGQISNECCNDQADGSVLCGSDCDGSNPAIMPGAQSCASFNEVQVCLTDGTWADAVACDAVGTRDTFGSVPDLCYEQANGTGVCGPDNQEAGPGPDPTDY